VQATCPQSASRGNSWTAIYYYYVNIIYFNPNNQHFISTFTLPSFRFGRERSKFADQTHKDAYINKQETLRTFNSVETKKYSRMPWNICCTKP
jgi:hypothetical protein